MRVRDGLGGCVGVLLLPLLVVAWCSGQSATGASPVSSQDFHFAISTAQPWTDTGVDLSPGDLLEITAKAPPAGAGAVPGNQGQSGSAASCDPQGTSSSAQSSNLPVPNAHPGALIARLQPEGDALLVGSGKELKMDNQGHLFLGVNGEATPHCTGSFSVKVHLVSTATASMSATEAVNATTPAAARTAVTPATGRRSRVRQPRKISSPSCKRQRKSGSPDSLARTAQPRPVRPLFRATL